MSRADFVAPRLPDTFNLGSKQLRSTHVIQNVDTNKSVEEEMIYSPVANK